MFVPMLLIVVIVFAVITTLSSRGGDLPVVDASKWQAVFLNNGQVYFGHAAITKEYVTLRDVFYLRANQPLQPQAAPTFDLIKLGGELHGPEDSMHVPSDSVLFWENMRADAQIVQAIDNYLKQNP